MRTASIVYFADYESFFLDIAEVLWLVRRKLVGRPIEKLDITPALFLAGNICNLKYGSELENK